VASYSSLTFGNVVIQLRYEVYAYTLADFELYGYCSFRVFGYERKHD